MSLETTSNRLDQTSRFDQTITYNVRQGWQIFGIGFALLACLGWPLFTLYFALTRPAAFANAWMLPVFLFGTVVMTGVGIIIYLAIALPRLVVSSRGLVYYSFGYTVRTGWENIAGWGEVRAGNTMIKGLLLREPVARISGWLKATLIIQPFLVLIAALGGRYNGGVLNSSFTRIIPVSNFTSDWENGYIGDYARQFAPHIFSDDPDALPPLPETLTEPEFEAENASPKLTSKENRPVLFTCAGMIGAVVVITLATIVVINFQVGGAKATWKGHSSTVETVAFSPDGKTVASGSADETVKLWDVATGRELLNFEGHAGAVNSVVFSPDGKIIASAGSSASIKLWEASTGKVIFTLNAHQDKVNSVAFSPDGKLLASGSGTTYSSKDTKDYSARLWDATTGKELASFPGQPYAVQAVAFSPDGKTLALGLSKGMIKLLEVTTGRELAVLPNTSAYDSLNALVFNPAGTVLAYVGSGGQIEVWDITKRTKLLHLSVYQGTIIPVAAIAFSPDGKYFAIACYDQTIKLFDSVTGKQVHTFSGHSAPVKALAFSPDGKTLVSGSDDSYNAKDHTIKVWEVKSQY